MTPNRRGRTEGSQRAATAGCVAYAVECRKSALPIGTAGQGVSGNDELASASPPGTRPDLRVTGQDSPQARYQALGYRAKRLLLGPPLQTAQLVHERISKRIALAVFSSDPISSTAYATEEMLLV